MSKISWIASYPKSGNTYIRLLLSAYFYTVDGKISNFEPINNIFKISRYDFLKNVPDIPSIDDFINQPKLISQYWEEAQKAISKKINKNLFIKTHDCMATISNNIFTSEKYTKSFIYVVRDPRSVAVSYSHHTGYDIDKTISYLISKNYIINYAKEEKTVPELVSSWNIHYNSWKNFTKKGHGIIIKYEDLVNNPVDEFTKILLFLKNFIQFEINEEKIIESVKSTQLNNLKKLEKKLGFKEKPINNKYFFRKGIFNEWKEALTYKQIECIEKNFRSEMNELNYL
tara:strand:+ start:1996 stop:2850 length:855 start_codon:yes stop_codon:yes gene_type:complete